MNHFSCVASKSFVFWCTFLGVACELFLGYASNQVCVVACMGSIVRVLPCQLCSQVCVWGGQVWGRCVDQLTRSITLKVCMLVIGVCECVHVCALMCLIFWFVSCPPSVQYCLKKWISLCIVCKIYRQMTFLSSFIPSLVYYGCVSVWWNGYEGILLLNNCQQFKKFIHIS